jgi:hypothetical protein
MKKVVLFALIAAAVSTPTWAQRAPTGRQTYPFNNTISCLQGGQVVVQYPRAWSIEQSWNRDQYQIDFRMPDGEPRTFNYSTTNMICLIEPVGRESVPVAERIAAEKQQQAEEQARQRRIEEFERSRGMRK